MIERGSGNHTTYAAERFTLPALMLCAFFGSATFTSVSPFLNEMAADFGRPIGVVGQLASASSLAAACSALLLFTTIERLQPKRVLLVALFGVGAFTVLTGLLTWFPAVLVAQFIAGGSATTAMTTSLVVLGRISADPAERARRQGLLIGMGGCGPLVGTPFLRLIADWSDWRAAVVFYGGVALVACGVAMLILPNLPAIGARGGGHLADAVSAARLPLVGRTLMLSASVWLIWGILGSFLAGFAEHSYPGQSWVIGGLWTTDGISYMVGAFGSGILILRLGGASRAVALALSSAMVALIFFVFVTIHPFWSLAMYFIWMGSLGILNSGIINLLYGFGRDRQGPVLFLSSAIGRIGTFIGGLIGGVALELSGWGGWSALLLVMAVTTFIPLASLLHGLRVRAREPRTGSESVVAASAISGPAGDA